jgi:predicted acylesterase/phospholipase RssA
MTSYQIVVLSGGGAKGPYGLGALLALEKFKAMRAKKVIPIFCGTSVGALNATLAAQGELPKLSSLYDKVSTKDILGEKSAKVGKLRMLTRLRQDPFHYFDNASLRSTIATYAKFEKLGDAHLLICATNYTTGRLETFYRSGLVDEFIEYENTKDRDSRRLVDFHRINSEDELVAALMASTAIPFYFPPISINKCLYVDGGIGNNTPLRQAAHLARFISCRDNVALEPTFCVINDPVRFKISADHANDISGVVRRTMDIYHNELVSDGYASWEKTNREIKQLDDQRNILASHIDGIDGMELTARTALKQRVLDALPQGTATTRKRNLPIHVVRPKTILLQNILEFEPQKSREIKLHGIADCLAYLQQSNLITLNDHDRWSEELD